MHTTEIKAEGKRFRWSVFRGGELVASGTRKRLHEAEAEAKGSARHFEKIIKRDGQGR
jgi:hypothetical protein